MLIYHLNVILILLLENISSEILHAEQLKNISSEILHADVVAN